MLVIKYGYMFQLFLSHPQANMVTDGVYMCVISKVQSAGIKKNILL